MTIFIVFLLASFEKPDEKSVVVSQWTSMLQIMAYHLDQAKLPYAIIEGSVTARKRMTLVDEFNRNPIKPKVTTSPDHRLSYKYELSLQMICEDE